MEIKWLGHSCFKFTCDNNSLVFDPFEDSYVPGLPNVREEANLCLTSHSHSDHNASYNVRIKGNSHFSIRSVKSYHDHKQGSLRGENTINIASINGFSVCHLGDLGHLLDENKLKEIGHVDLLLVPIGGYYTIDAEEAIKIIDLIKPRIAIPMHFKGKGFGYDVLEGIDRFKALAKNVTVINSNALEITDETKGIYILDWRENNAC